MTTIADLSGLSNLNGIGDVATFANTQTNGILFFGYSIILFIVLLLAFKRFSFTKGFMAASWILFILTGILWFGGFMIILFPIIYLIMSIAGVVFVWLEA